MQKPELLAPAGSFDSLVAAVQSGADAVYFGTGAFNARAFAKNFGPEELEKAIDYCHVRGVSAHVTMNTLLLDKELDDALNAARELYRLGADALIVQDLGLISALRRELPDFPLHASTQMAVCDENGALEVQRIGLSRAVLAREVSIEGIRRIKNKTDIPLEVFAGGAMCSSVSGQCLLSSFIGGRSGNRGACAQPCRMKYRFEGSDGYLLSMKDLCLLNHVNELAEAGVCSLKIEGRMKRPEYVAVVTEAYRRAIDGETESLGQLRGRLLRAFNRGGFSSGYYNGRDGLVAPERPGNWGVQVGRVEKGFVRLDAPLIAGDELAVREIGADQDISIEIRRDIPAGKAVFEELKSPRFLGLAVYRTADAALNREAMERVAAKSRRTAVNAHLRAVTGEPLKLTFSSGKTEITVFGEQPVKRADKSPATKEKLTAQISKLGDTPFILGGFSALLGEAPVFVPSSELNALRREAAEKLEKALAKKRNRSLPESAEQGFMIFPKDGIQNPQKEEAKIRIPDLAVQAADPAQAKAALELGIKTIYVQPQLWNRERFFPFVELCEKYGAGAFPVFPAVTLNDDLNRAMDVIGSFPEGTFSGAVASNIGQVFALRGVFDDVRGDYTLNITNSLSALAHLAMGLTKVTLSAELTAPQIRDIINKIPGELLVYGALPMMHLMHCPVRENKGACGQDCFDNPCRELTDRRDYRFPLFPIGLEKGGCDVRLLNTLPIDGLRAFGELIRICAPCWRLNFYRESAKAVEERVCAYLEALNGGAVRPAEPSTSGHFSRGVAKQIQKRTTT